MATRFARIAKLSAVLVAAIGFGLAGTVKAETGGSAKPGVEVDGAHSTVGFWVKHLGLSKVRGQFDKFSAKLDADVKTMKLRSVEATIEAASINTFIAKRDEHLRGPDFFDAARFPSIKLKTRSIEWKGNSLTGIADLTIKGKTLPVAFAGELTGIRKVNFGQGDQVRAGYTVVAEVNRLEFGLGFNMLAEGVKVVDDIVHIELEIEVQRPAN